MTRNSRLNSLTGTKNKRVLFKVVKTNWTHNNRPFLDTWFIVHLGFRSEKEFQRPRHVRIFLFGLLPFFKRVGRSIVNDPCRSALEYSIADKYSKLCKNDIFIDFI